MTVSAIVPAYNEEDTISDVVNILKRVEKIDEIIVVSDGSKDNTVKIARECGANVIELPVNSGKGAALKAGLDICEGDIVVFLDADLVGLNTSHVDKLLAPVLAGEAGMTVGIFSNGRLRTDLAHKISPSLSGQRVVRRNVLDNIKDMALAGYGIEIVLTKYAEKENITVREVELDDLTHVMKEEKLGLVKGFGERLKMYWEVYRETRMVRK